MVKGGKTTPAQKAKQLGIGATYDKYLEEQTKLGKADSKQFLYNVPLVGDFMRAFDAHNKLYDVYHSTGHLPSYDQLSSGYGGMANLVSRPGRNAGTKSLNAFYKQF